MTLTALALIAILLALATLILRKFARGFLRPGQRRSQKTPATLGLDGAAFAVPTPAGALRGWFIRAAPEPRATVVIVHGWQSHAGDMLGWVAPIVNAGCHAVVYDTLGHGDSDPSEFTSIRHFFEDVRVVLAHVRTLPMAQPGIVLMGHSMGGAAALLAAADDSGVRAVIAAAAPTDAIEITREWLDARGLPGSLLIATMRPFWSSIVQGPYAELKPILRIAKIRVPILIVHGSDDRQVPVAHAQRLAAANPAAEMIVLPGADHFSLPKHADYHRIVREFLTAATSVTSPRQ